jgi:hypothetical protein
VGEGDGRRLSDDTEWERMMEEPLRRPKVVEYESLSDNN